ncbi:MAG: DUF6082 family protein [Streptosporangiaceae bacterium]
MSYTYRLIFWIRATVWFLKLFLTVDQKAKFLFPARSRVLPIPAESARIRDHLYIHMWATFWAGNYAVGELNAAAVRGVATEELFSSTAGRAYWAVVRERILSTTEGKYRRFARIVDEEYQRVIASNVPVADPVRITNYANDSTTQRRARLRRFTLVSATLITGALAGRKLSQRPRRGR